jgi:hypothetical protein
MPLPQVTARMAAAVLATDQKVNGRRSTARMTHHAGTARKYSSRTEAGRPQMTITAPTTCADDSC